MNDVHGGAAAAAAPHPRGRLLSLDVFRGMTVAAMLLVNTPGSWGAIYAPLRHAEWHGWTPTDLIFPFFLFIVGVTTHISLTGARARGATDAELVGRILRRGALIVLLGLLVSAFPYLPLERITGMRIPGVLQRIGVVYMISALLTLRGSVKMHVAALALILLGYWLVMTGIPVPGQPPGAARLEPPASTMAAYVDRLLLEGHLWQATRSWDPEGVLSTLPAIGTALLGVLAGGWIRSPRPLEHRVTWLLAAGVGGLLLGWLWGLVFPINKNIWTSSYVIFTGGFAAVVLAACIWLVDLRKVTWWTRPFAIYGLNPLVAFVGSAVMARTMYSLVKVSYEGAVIPLQAAVYRHFFASWLAPRNASLLFAIAFVLLWLGILALLARRNIVIKV